MVNSHFFCAVIEPHVSHSCASELSTGLSLQQWQAASCKLHDSVCATLLKPAPLGMRIDSLRKSFIKMPCLPTVQVPAGCKRTFNAVAMPIANCQLPWTWTCGCHCRCRCRTDDASFACGTNGCRLRQFASLICLAL